MKIVQKGLHNKIVTWFNNGAMKEGRVVLVYLEAIASGTNDYVNVTMLLVVDDQGGAYNIYPRQICSVNMHVGRAIKPIPDGIDRV
jgi:hypothetical protein